MTLWHRLNPRLNLAAAIGWTVAAISVIFALTAATLAANLAEQRIRTDVERLLTQFASQISHSLTMTLNTRRLVVQASATQILAANDRGTNALRAHLEAVQAQFPEFSWLGVVDDQGRVVAATGAILLGENVAESQWFRRGRLGTFFGEVQDAPLLENQQPRELGAPPPHFVDIAVPLTHANGVSVGVLSARLSWHWIRGLPADLLAALDTSRQLDLLIVGEDGTVLIGPGGWSGRNLPAEADLAESATYIVGRHAPSGKVGPNWTVIVRQTAAVALAPAYLAYRTVFLIVAMAGLVSALVAARVTWLLTRRLTDLAEQARAIRRGERTVLAVPTGRDEVSRIGGVLAETIQNLQSEKRALATLNSELETRVAERSARIERLADEARHAAVARERLRLARDLHDTLAHSLMALLTQIRMVRKLRNKLSNDELEAELGRAEGVASSGLTEARAAIAQMRHNGVRDVGLAGALGELLTNFRERTGITSSLRADPEVASLADNHAETVFRIVEEALHNVELHAQATEVRVQLHDLGAPLEPATGAGLRAGIEVADNGIGFDPAQPRPGHYGLCGIAEQATLIGARFELFSAPGKGTRLVLEFDT